jgi:hypothetical protein
MSGWFLAVFFIPFRGRGGRQTNDKLTPAAVGLSYRRFIDWRV